MATNCTVLTGGFVVPVDECAQINSGVWHNRIWFGSRREIVGFTESATPNQYEAITFTGTNGLWEVEIEKDSGVWRNEYDEGTKSTWQALSFRINNLSITARNFIQNLKGPDMVVIAQLKAGVFQIIGKDSGANLFTCVGSSEGEEAGYAVEIRAQNMDEFSPHFLDTNEATTLTTLDGYVVTT